MSTEGGRWSKIPHSAGPELWHTFYLNFVRHSVTAIVIVRYATMVKNTIKPNHKLNSLLKYTTAMTMSISVGKILKRKK